MTCLNDFQGLPPTQLEQLSHDLVDRALRAGATAADATVREGEEFSVTLRLGQIENLKEASSKILGLRVFLGSRSATSYSSDFSRGALDRLVERSVAMARATSEDEASGLPDAALMGRYSGDLQLYSDDVTALTADERISMARRAEQAALDTDPRIRNSEGSWFESGWGAKAYSNSLGFTGGYRSSYCSLTVIPVAQNGAGGADGAKGGSSMQRDYWYSVSRRAGGLERPEAVGKKAAERALRRLGGRKVPTCQVPVVFESETSPSLLAHIFEAVRGDAIYRGASFLAGKLGERVAGENVTVLDDGLRPGGFGSRPFDDEAIPPSVTPVIERGVLRNYLLNSYTARRLKLCTTGNASRGVAGPPGVGPKNFYIEPGHETPQEMLRSVKNGFYVTELIGSGVNVVTGDYSRGAAGLWIENGELTFPVEEVTIAGNLSDMLNHIAVIGSDLEFRGSIAAPTLVVEGLTVAGT